MNIKKYDKMVINLHKGKPALLSKDELIKVREYNESKRNKKEGFNVFSKKLKTV